VEQANMQRAVLPMPNIPPAVLITDDAGEGRIEQTGVSLFSGDETLDEDRLRPAMAIQ
jgi:hypothetical protein